MSYENIEVIETVLKKTKRYIENPQIEQTLLADVITQTGRKTVAVLDFGGACGIHFFMCRNAINRGVKLKWKVIETPETVKRAAELGNAELSFIDSIPETSGRIDVVHCSGSLQCTEKPIETLAKLTRLNPVYIVLSRLGLNRGENAVTTQHRSFVDWHGRGRLSENNGNEVFYPLTFAPENQFLDLIADSGYEIVRRIEDESGVISVRRTAIVGYGLVCKRIS